MFKHYLTAFVLAWRQLRSQPKQAIRSREEFEFQPGYLEILERAPAPWARRTALLLTASLLLALLWSIIGRLDIHAGASGRLIVSSYSKVIQALEPGEIAAIRVHNGQRVKAGDVLLSLNPIGVEAEMRELQAQLRYRQLERARLEALLTEDPVAGFQPPEGLDERQIGQARAHLASEWREVRANLESLDSELAVTSANLAARQKEIAALEKLAANISARLGARRTLAASKLLPRMELLEQERELLETERALTQQHASISVLKAEYQSRLEQRSSYLAKLRREYYDKLGESRSAIAVLNEQLVKVAERRRQQQLTAPVDGVVQQLAVHTLGGAVQAAQELMVVVPDDAALEAEVKILNKDVGFVRAGQEVAIKIDAFPYTRYGTIAGEVAHVSRDAVQDEQLGLVFPARIRLHSASMVVEDQRVALQPGMSVMGEIRTGDRRVIDYLLSPLQQYQSEALGER